VAAATRVDLRIALAAIFAALTLTTAAHAGQVRVDVGPGTAFTPSAVNVNLGDQVVWVWTGTLMHTVTSGDSSALVPDGTFNSDPAFLGQGSFTRFSWKSDVLGTTLYFCAIHEAAMAGRIIVSDPNSGPPVAVADFRLTEVQYNRASGQDLIEVANFGAAAGNLGRYRINVSGAGTGTELPVTNVIVSPQGRVVIHLNASGTNTNTDVFIPSFAPGTGLPNGAGSLALYAPSTVSPENALSNGDLLLDFVEWGAGSQANESTAAGNLFWVAGSYVPLVAAGHSIEYCPDSANTHDSGRWIDMAVPDFGSPPPCTLPTGTNPRTWGNVKTIYRR
jgi:plastocyanin